MLINDKPIVSVIIPVYNGAQYIQAAVESVLSQTFQDLEIIVVDDGSTDKVKDILNHWIKDNIIQYIYQENRGLPAARNTGIKAAQGRFIKFLDSDDFLYPKQIEGQVDQIILNDNFFSISDYCLLRPKGEIVHFEYHPIDEKHQLAAFFEVNQAPVHAFLVSKAIIQKAGCFDETLTACEDWDLWIRILQGGAVMKHLPYAGCCYRILTTSISVDAERMFLQKCKLFEKINAWLIQEENLSFYSERMQEFMSIFRTNKRMIEECMLRGISRKTILPNALKMTSWLFRQHERKTSRIVHALVGTENCVRIGYWIRAAIKKNYKYELLNESALWRFGLDSQKDEIMNKVQQ
ncbi:glycosyltransferase family 2 protein [Candidatus Omnitrophota bacterium]